MSGPRRRRLLVIALVVLLTLAGVAGAMVLGPAPGTPGARPSAPRTAPQIALDRAGFSGPAGGSLRGDPRTLTAIGARVAQLSLVDDHQATAPSAVRTLWAGDLGAGRYAVALYGSNGSGWSTAVLYGAAGAPAGRLDVAQWLDDGMVSDDSVLSGHSATFVGRAGDGDAGVVLVVAPKASGVEIAAERTFAAEGDVHTYWRRLVKQGGAVWIGLLDANELYLDGYRTTEPALDQPPVVIDAPDDHAAARAVATGSGVRSADGLDVVDCAADEAKTVGASPAERPVTAPVSVLDESTTLAAVVLRSPDGGWLWGLCDREQEKVTDGSVEVSDYTGGGVARERWSDAGQAMGAMSARVPARDDTDEGPPRFVVLAPAGADHVRISGVTATVRDRLAEITLPARKNRDQVTVEALHGGRVIARCTARSDT